MLKQDVVSSLMFYEKDSYAHCLSYATLVRYIVFLGAVVCNLPCRNVFLMIFPENEAAPSQNTQASNLFLPNSTEIMPAWYMKLNSL